MKNGYPNDHVLFLVNVRPDRDYLAVQGGDPRGFDQPQMRREVF